MYPHDIKDRTYHFLGWLAKKKQFHATINFTRLSFTCISPVA